jgi:transposase InsO family protein
MSEVDWVVDRAKLYDLHRQNPENSTEYFAQQLKRSVRWVKKWIKRFAQADPDDETMFLSQSRARHTSSKKVTPEVEKAVLSIRDEPPDNLRGIPGPKTILYFLSKRLDLKEAGHYLPRSTSTIWQILDNHQRIIREKRPKSRPEEPAEPMADWQIDFKSIGSVPPEVDGKRQHVVETFNVVDKGTSILIDAIPRGDYQAETALISLIDILTKHGVPQSITFDRDPRFVGSWTAQDFPSALMRFLHVIGVQPRVCPAHRPDKNGYVERYHKSYQQECLSHELPNSLAKTIECTQTYQHHYNHERPHQGRACQNQPPRVVFPDVQPSGCLPSIVDPDRWLLAASQRVYRRRVNKNGSGGISTMWVNGLPSKM